MSRLILAAALLALPAAALSQSVEVADGNWSDIPWLAPSKAIRMGDRSMARIDKLIDTGKCLRFGKTEKFRMDVPFLLQFGAGGTVKRIVVQRLDCPELESTLGGIIASHAQEGLYKPTGENQTGWYRGEFSYHTF